MKIFLRKNTAFGQFLPLWSYICPSKKNWYRVPGDSSGQNEIHHSFTKLISKSVTLKTPFSVVAVASDDSHLPVVLAGNLGMPFVLGICRAEKSHDRPAVVRWFGLRLCAGLASPALHRPQGNTLKTTRHTIAKSSLHEMDIRVV